MEYRSRMKKIRRKQWIRRILFLGILLALSFFFSSYFRENPTEKWNESTEKNVSLTDGGLDFSFNTVTEKTVKEFLENRNLMLREGDSVFPDEETLLFSGTHIIILRAHILKVMIDREERILHTQAVTIGQALEESDLALDADDIVKPSREILVEDGMKVIVTRVQITEESVEKPIAFDTKINEDETLSWRKNIVTQKGENGTKRLVYRVSSYDGKEVSRKLLRTEVMKEPVTQVTTQGTYVKLGKSHTGASSWYAYTGTMSAANPWLPMGSYVKVTNTENGKSVIVRINDRGPFAPERIIDLDKVAFAKISSLGAGVINVKMEEITN